MKGIYIILCTIWFFCAEDRLDVNPLIHLTVMTQMTVILVNL